MSASITILASHPYWTCLKPAVSKQSWDSKWTVRWRDFYTCKLAAEFNTEQEAHAFAAALYNPPLTLDGDWGPEDLADANQFWCQLKRKHNW